MVRPEDCSLFTRHIAGDGGIRLLLPLSRLNLHFCFPENLLESKVKAIPGERSIREIDVRLMKGTLEIQSISMIDLEQPDVSWLVPPDVDLKLDISGQGWNKAALPYRLEPGETLTSNVDLGLNQSFSTVRLLNIHDPELFPTGTLHVTDITGHESLVSSDLTVPNHRSTLQGRLNLFPVSVTVDRDRDPSIECASGFRRTFLVVADEPYLFPRVIVVDAMEADHVYSVDARMRRGGLLEVVRRAASGSSLIATYARQSDPRRQPLQFHGMRRMGGDYWGTYVAPDSTATTESCLLPGVYILHLRAHQVETPIEFTIREGETTRIEVD